MPKPILKFHFLWKASRFPRFLVKIILSAIVIFSKPNASLGSLGEKTTLVDMLNLNFFRKTNKKFKAREGIQIKEGFAWGVELPLYSPLAGRLSVLSLPLK